MTEAAEVAAQVAMGSGSGERGAQGGGRPETAQAGSSPLARGPGGTCPARSLNARRRPGPRESPARVPIPVEGCEALPRFGKLSPWQLSVSVSVLHQRSEDGAVKSR